MKQVQTLSGAAGFSNVYHDLPEVSKRGNLIRLFETDFPGRAKMAKKLILSECTIVATKNVTQIFLNDTLIGSFIGVYATHEIPSSSYIGAVKVALKKGLYFEGFN